MGLLVDALLGYSATRLLGYSAELAAMRVLEDPLVGLCHKFLGIWITVTLR
jgi:hypothetical protein